MTQQRVASLAHAVVVPGFDGATTPDWLVRRVDRGLGGVCWFGQNVPDLVTARALADALHDQRADLLVLCDEEGGDVTRLEAVQGSSWPGHAALGHLDDLGATQDVAAALGRQVRSAGIDVALAPVVDVNSDPGNPVIGVRSFGDDPTLVGRHAAAFVTGLQSAGVAACAKHFPGHGATRTDSHLELPRVDDAEGVLRERDIAPFAAAVDAGVRCVMTAHVLFPAIDDEPATMSRSLLGLLREELGFDGVIASDALDMRAISHGVGQGPGAVRALAAGVDLLCIGNPSFPAAYDAEAVLDEVVAAIVTAVAAGVVPVARLEQAASRVTDLSTWVRQQPMTDRDDEADRWLGRSVADRVVEVRGDVRLSRPPLFVHVSGSVGMAAGRRRPHVLDVLASRYPDSELVTVNEAECDNDVANILGRINGRQLVLVVSIRGDGSGDTSVQALVGAVADALVISTGGAGSRVPGDRVVCTYGDGRALAEAAVDRIWEGPHR